MIRFTSGTLVTAALANYALGKARSEAQPAGRPQANLHIDRSPPAREQRIAIMATSCATPVTSPAAALAISTNHVLDAVTTVVATVGKADAETDAVVVPTALRFERQIDSGWEAVAKHHFHKPARDDMTITVLENSIEESTGRRTIRRQFTVNYSPPWWLAVLVRVDKIRFVEEAMVDEREQVLELRSRNLDFAWLGVAEEHTLVSSPGTAASESGRAVSSKAAQAAQSEAAQAEAAGAAAAAVAAGAAAATISTAAAAAAGEQSTLYVQEGGVSVRRSVAGRLAPPCEKLITGLFASGGGELLEEKAHAVKRWEAALAGPVQALPWVSEGAV
jgi:hypothetical protein